MSDTPAAPRVMPLPEHFVTVGRSRPGTEPGIAFPHVLTFVVRYPMGKDTPIGLASNK
jgi:hypothetical protein